jgi:hypothetical protein
MPFWALKFLIRGSRALRRLVSSQITRVPSLEAAGGVVATAAVVAGAVVAAAVVAAAVVAAAVVAAAVVAAAVVAAAVVAAAVVAAAVVAAAVVAAGAAVVAAGALVLVASPQAAMRTNTSIVATKDAKYLYEFLLTASPPLEKGEKRNINR